MDEEFRKYIIENLDRAIDEGWIKAYHQPVVRAANGRISEEEAFARWEDPNHGLIMPDSFIPILDEEKLTYKLDLRITELVLEKMQRQIKDGFYVVPESVNISGADFYSCDLAKEISERVDKAGIGRDKIIIEISEDYISRDYTTVKKEVLRFRELGFKIWMDDFGKGFSSPLTLQEIPFDALKLDHIFMQMFDRGDRHRIILTELIKIALVLGIDTVAEGVETGEQSEFLKEIGCTKQQGLYHCGTNTYEGILERYEKGIQIGFENPDESGYYEDLGRVNLYDLSTIVGEEGDLSGYFDAMPVAVMESDGRKVKIIRSNRSYRKFLLDTIATEYPAAGAPYADYVAGPGSLFMKSIKTCAETGRQIVVDDMSETGDIFHVLLRRVAVNPISGVASVAVVILGVVDRESQRSDVTYTYIARALAADYIFLNLVDLDTDEFIEFKSDIQKGDLRIISRGGDFFGVRRERARNHLYEPDLEDFLDSFTKENIARNLKEHGRYSVTSRVNFENGPEYVSMKAVKVRGRGNKIIIGVTNVDAQMKEQEAIERVKEERITYSRVMALSSDYLCIYTIDPDTGHFERYNASEDYERLNFLKEGDDFFEAVEWHAVTVVYEEDYPHFKSMFNKETIFQSIESNGVFVLNIRLVMDGEPVYVLLKAAKVQEKDGEKILLGITNVDARVKRDQVYMQQLNIARAMANVDELTGVKNKHAYVDVETRMNEEIENGEEVEFAIVIFDLNGLKEINDTMGHQAGDRFIQEGCSIICSIFQHSPVFRVGGDEFAVIAKDGDYRNIDALMEKLSESNKKNLESGGVVIAGGMARFYGDRSVSAVFERADSYMYKNKTELKRGHA
ncbi:MAG: GGDEF domain-containing protein [Lachnospiraceae bacterium]|nr:GGDEF domain-containing protein [Lachnospiraceae bacterium]